MKRYGNLFQKVVQIPNIKKAIKSAASGKTNHNNVKPYLNYINETAYHIRQLLLTDNFRPRCLTNRKIVENGKHRIITSSRFYPDQIVYWSLMNILAPCFMRPMYYYNMATIPHRGCLEAKQKISKWLRVNRSKTKYVLKTDIHHFYPSINHAILKRKLRNLFKDPHILHILDMTIDCYSPGLPLGLYTSQWLANYFLTPVDHWVKEQCHVNYYVRYMDDQLFLDNNKRKLHKTLIKLKDKLNKLDLHIKPSWQVWRLTKHRPIDFLGYKFYRGYTTLRGRDYLKIKRKFKKVNHQITSNALSRHNICSLLSYWGWVKHTDSYHLYTYQLKPLVSVRFCKKFASLSK